MDAEPKNWSRSCEAAKQLRIDLYENIIEPEDAPKDVQGSRSVYKKVPKNKFAPNYRNLANDFIMMRQLNNECAMKAWVEDGKPYVRKQGKCTIKNIASIHWNF